MLLSWSRQVEEILTRFAQTFACHTVCMLFLYICLDSYVFCARRLHVLFSFPGKGHGWNGWGGETCESTGTKHRCQLRRHCWTAFLVLHLSSQEGTHVDTLMMPLIHIPWTGSCLFFDAETAPGLFVFSSWDRGVIDCVFLLLTLKTKLDVSSFWICLPVSGKD